MTGAAQQADAQAGSGAIDEATPDSAADSKTTGPSSASGDQQADELRKRADVLRAGAGATDALLEYMQSLLSAPEPPAPPPRPVSFPTKEQEPEEDVKPAEAPAAPLQPTPPTPRQSLAEQSPVRRIVPRRASVISFGFTDAQSGAVQADLDARVTPRLGSFTAQMPRNPLPKRAQSFNMRHSHAATPEPAPRPSISSGAGIKDHGRDVGRLSDHQGQQKALVPGAYSLSSEAPSSQASRGASTGTLPDLNQGHRRSGAQVESVLATASGGRTSSFGAPGEGPLRRAPTRGVSFVMAQSESPRALAPTSPHAPPSRSASFTQRRSSFLRDALLAAIDDELSDDEDLREDAYYCDPRLTSLLQNRAAAMHRDGVSPTGPMPTSPSHSFTTAAAKKPPSHNVSFTAGSGASSPGAAGVLSSDSFTMPGPSSSLRRQASRSDSRSRLVLSSSPIVSRMSNDLLEPCMEPSSPRTPAGPHSNKTRFQQAMSSRNASTNF